MGFSSASLFPARKREAVTCYGTTGIEESKMHLISNKERRKKERKMKRVKRKGIEALRVRHLTPSRECDALIRDEEQNRKQTRKDLNAVKKKKGKG